MTKRFVLGPPVMPAGESQDEKPGDMLLERPEPGGWYHLADGRMLLCLVERPGADVVWKELHEDERLSPVAGPVLIWRGGPEGRHVELSIDGAKRIAVALIEY